MNNGATYWCIVRSVTYQIKLDFSCHALSWPKSVEQKMVSIVTVKVMNQFNLVQLIYLEMVQIRACCDSTTLLACCSHNGYRISSDQYGLLCVYMSVKFLPPFSRTYTQRGFIQSYPVWISFLNNKNSFFSISEASNWMLIKTFTVKLMMHILCFYHCLTSIFYEY